MAHWNAWWWSRDEWQAEADRPMGGGGGGGPAFAAADPSTDRSERPMRWPDNGQLD